MEEWKSRDERKQGRNREIRKIKDGKETEIGIRIGAVYMYSTSLLTTDWTRIQSYSLFSFWWEL
jgi:hypothetical protein